MGQVTTVDTFQPPKEATGKSPAPEVVQKMLEQARTGVTRTEADPLKAAPEAERPAWLPEKFKSVEDMAKAYGELEKKQGAKPADAPKPGIDSLKIEKPAEGTPAEAPKTEEQKAADKAVESAGLDMGALNTEYAETGDLSPESYAKLEKAGITKDVVAGYIAGQQALAERFIADLHSVAGGQEQFEQMHAWSAQNLPPAEIAALNAAIESNNHQAIKLAFSGVYGKYVAAGQNEPTGQIHGAKSVHGGDLYGHRDEIMADMKTDKYKTNQGERDRVAQKIKRSNIW